MEAQSLDSDQTHEPDEGNSVLDARSAPGLGETLV
jgi:hypothetical protein